MKTIKYTLFLLAIGLINNANAQDLYDNYFPKSAEAGQGVISFGGGILNQTNPNNDGQEVYTWLKAFQGIPLNGLENIEAGGTLAVQGGTDTANNGAYIQFEISTENLQDLEISYATRRTGSGFNSQSWSYSTNGTDFNQLQEVNLNSVNEWEVIEIATPQTTNNVATLTLRVTLNGATSELGNNRFDNINFNAVELLNTTSFLDNDFVLYPNPVRNGLVNINTKSNVPFDVSVFDVLGKQVISKTISNNALNVSSLKSGIYLVQVTQNNTTSTKKLIIN